jgi:Holliday junction resolvasome RuvABC endonuclease subunit
MSIKRCIGIDQSTKATGVVISEGDVPSPPEVIHDVLLKPKTTLDLYDRQTFMWDNIMQLIEDYAPEIVCIEGYGLNLRKPSALIPLVGLGEVLRFQMREAKIPFICPTPAENKIFATGNGNTDKPGMIKAAAVHGYVTKDDNMADAFFLSRLGLCFKHSLHRPTTQQVEVIENLKQIGG